MEKFSPQELKAAQKVISQLYYEGDSSVSTDMIADINVRVENTAVDEKHEKELAELQAKIDALKREKYGEAVSTLFHWISGIGVAILLLVILSLIGRSIYDTNFSQSAHLASVQSAKLWEKTHTLRSPTIYSDNGWNIRPAPTGGTWKNTGAVEVLASAGDDIGLRGFDTAIEGQGYTLTSGATVPELLVEVGRGDGQDVIVPNGSVVNFYSANAHMTLYARVISTDSGDVEVIEVKRGSNEA